MKIVSIFENKLFAFHYDNEVDNEFDRLMDLWTDVYYLQLYAKRNKVKEVYDFIEEIVKCAEEIEDFLDDITQNNTPYGFYFEALQESEQAPKILALQKGKIPKNQLRLYAIKIDKNCFVITGGAIKMSQKMQDHPDTNQELVKLKAARQFLSKHGVSDEDSFFELLREDI